VHDLLPEWASQANDDLIVFTTLDPAMQRSAEAAVRSALVREGKPRNVGQAALVAMDRFGAVKAMVGGRSYTKANSIVRYRRSGSRFGLQALCLFDRPGQRLMP
jgi:penicillin-binding protein 1A